MAIYKTRAGQSISDIALEVYGGVDGVFVLLEDNPVLNNTIDSLPSPGTELKVRETNPLNSTSVFTVAELNRNGNKIASAPDSQVAPSGYVDMDYVQLDYVE